MNTEARPWLWLNYALGGLLDSSGPRRPRVDVSTRMWSTSVMSRGLSHAGQQTGIGMKGRHGGQAFILCKRSKIDWHQKR